MCSGPTGKVRVMHVGSTEVPTLIGSTLTVDSSFTAHSMPHAAPAGVAWMIVRRRSRLGRCSDQAELVFEPRDLEEAAGGLLRAAQVHGVFRAELLPGPDERTEPGRIDEADLVEV